MRIGIEAQRIFRSNKHGMDYVILEVLRQLQTLDTQNEYFVFVAPGEDFCLEESSNMHVIVLKCPTYVLWEQFALPRAVRKYKVSVLHCTSNTAPLYCKVPLILTLHDIIYLTTPRDKGMSLYQKLGWYYRRWNVPRIVSKCKKIITVSNIEQQRITSYFPSVGSKISVVHNGYSECYQLLETNYVKGITEQYLNDETFLFFLGNSDPRKNLINVLKAYSIYRNKSEHPLKLIITGLKKEYVENVLTNLKVRECIPYIVYTGYVPGIDLPALYNAAYAFLFPSLQEGFGIPVLEAMACGTPVVTSNCSSMPEIAGKEAILINPNEPEDIANAILKLESDKIYYNTQKNYGLERAKKFSWKQTAEAYLQIYKTL